MNKGIFVTIGIIASLLAIISSLIYLLWGLFIPGLMSFSLVIVMVYLIFSSRKLYKEGKVSKGYWSFILFICSTAVLLNAFGGIMQIINSIR